MYQASKNIKNVGKYKKRCTSTLELSNDLVESMLHSIRQVVRLLTHNFDTISEYLPHILQSRFVSFASFICL